MASMRIVPVFGRGLLGRRSFRVLGTLAFVLALGAAYGAIFADIRRQSEQRDLHYAQVACTCSDGTACTIRRSSRLPWGLRQSMPDGSAALLRDDAGDLFELSCRSGAILLTKVPALRT